MTKISWKQIDTNNNGYLDGNEVQAAKEKGIKNVWNYMTLDDLRNNVTREQKLKNIKGSYTKNSNDSDSNNNVLSLYSNSPVMSYNQDEQDYMQYIKDDHVLKFQCKKELLQKELKKVENEYNQEFGIVGKVLNCISPNEKYKYYKNKINELKQAIEECNLEFKRYLYLACK